MSYPTAAGHPNRSGIDIPMIYATALLIAFYTASVFGAITTNEYEGQIKSQGDTVRIRTLPDIAIRDYVKGQGLEYENLEGSFVDLLIDKGKYWTIPINAVDKVQFDYDQAEKWAEHASNNLKVAIDSDILSNIYSQAHAANKGAAAGAKSASFDLGSSGSPFQLTKANIIDYIIDCGVVLDEQDVPDENRWFTLPAWACGLLKKSDLQDASITGDGKSVLRNGRIGMIDRFTIYRTNNLADVTDTAKVTNAMFGHKCAITFASQMIERETLKNPKDFGDLIRALQVFGYKAVKPEALGHAYVTRG